MGHIIILPEQRPLAPDWIGALISPTQYTATVSYFDITDTASFATYLGDESATYVNPAPGSRVANAFTHDPVNDYIIIQWALFNTNCVVRVYDRLTGTIISTSGGYSDFPNNRAITVDPAAGRIYISRVVSQAFIEWIPYPVADGVPPVLTATGVVTSESSSHVDISMDKDDNDFIWAWHNNQQVHRYDVPGVSEADYGPCCGGCSGAEGIAHTYDQRLIIACNNRIVMRDAGPPPNITATRNAFVTGGPPGSIKALYAPPVGQAQPYP